MRWRSVLLGGVVLGGCCWVATTFASVCGPADETQDVELYDGGRGLSKEQLFRWQAATGQLRWNSSFIPPLTAEDDPGNLLGVRWCTGTLFSEKLFLTAGNCFDASAGGWSTPARRVGNSFVPLPPQELAPLTHVNFNLQRDTTTCATPTDPRTCAVRKPDSYPVVRLLEYRRGNLNYAILELGAGADGQLPGQRYNPANLDSSSAALAQAKLLAIIQHSGGGPKRVGIGTQLRISNDRISYGDIDTFGGSGGAGILDQSGRLVGLHTNGGCDVTGGENWGITVRAISEVSDIIR
jgi:hypothetical protein